MNIPFVEKYRPTNMYEIVLDNETKTIMKNIVENDYFPNLLLYGPPGTGKTTTIINLIRKYKEIHNENINDSVIHLNSSDERGIDVIRHQIHTFISSNNLFSYNSMKFIILDEVDYMTKPAQYALKCLIQQYQPNIRYCLMCNYIYKIDESLKTEFVLLRYNNLPRDDIIRFLKEVNTSENLTLTDTELSCIQQKYVSDIRSMLNYMQLLTSRDTTCNIFDEIVEFSELFEKIRCKQIKWCANKFMEISTSYDKDIQSIWKQYLLFIMLQRREHIIINSDFINIMEKIISSSANHFTQLYNEYYFSLLMKTIIS
jgi:DNA polymerase III delta prime subunit